MGIAQRLTVVKQHDTEPARDHLLGWSAPNSRSHGLPDTPQALRWGGVPAAKHPRKIAHHGPEPKSCTPFPTDGQVFSCGHPAASFARREAPFLPRTSACCFMVGRMRCPQCPWPKQPRHAEGPACTPPQSPPPKPPPGHHMHTVRPGRVRAGRYICMMHAAAARPGLPPLPFRTSRRAKPDGAPPVPGAPFAALPLVIFSQPKRHAPVMLACSGYATSARAPSGCRPRHPTHPFRYYFSGLFARAPPESAATPTHTTTPLPSARQAGPRAVHPERPGSFIGTAINAPARRMTPRHCSPCRPRPSRCKISELTLFSHLPLDNM